MAGEEWLDEIRASIARVGAPAPTIFLLGEYDRLTADLAAARAERDALREAGDRLATEADGLLGEIINADDMVPTTKRYAALEAAVNQYRALADRRGGGEGR